MFNGKKDYRQVNLDDFSSDEDEEAPTPSSSSNYGANNRNGGGGGLSQSQMMMKKQDEGLEMLSQYAGRLGEMSMAINEELTSQNRILDDMDDDMDQANENMDYVTRRTTEFIRRSGGMQNCLIIATLSAIVVLLILLILYT